jgi:Concanavalin A-like lectin/glucanases superfamily
MWLVLSLAACRGRFDAQPRVVDAFVSYRVAVLASTPLGYWRFGDSTTPTDEVTGASATLAGGCTAGVAGALAGDADTAFAFDGTCRITLPTDYDFPGNQPFAIEVWLSTQSDAAFHLPFAREVRGPQDPIDGYALVVAPVPGGFALERVISGSNIKAGPVAFTPSTYHHVVAQYSGAELQIFVDGVLGDQHADLRSANEITADSLVGAAMPGNFYIGSLDELAIYNRALTDDEIAHHHAIGAGD